MTKLEALAKACKDKRIAELEEKISVLLSCKNCPENKGGFICQKEYEDKCLAQKIQYIKELKEENAKLKNKLEHRNCLDCSNHSSKLRMRNLDLEKENAELKESNKMLEQGYVWHDYDAGEDCYEDTHEGKWVKRDEVYQLTKAKEIIKKFSEFVNNGIEYDPEHPQEHTDLWNKLCEEAEQFLKDCEVEK